MILALASWRIASFLVTEEGPFALFGRLRERFQASPASPSVLGRGLSCLWCVSVWAGLLWAALYYLWRPAVWLALPFTLSALAIGYETVIANIEAATAERGRDSGTR